MAEPLLPVSAVSSEDASSINSPNLSEKTLKPEHRSVTSVDQINRIISNLEEAGRTRADKNGRIMAKYNAERPYEPERLKAEGLGWKSNFSTKPLATAIDKIAPRLSGAIQSARYLTSASLPDSVPNARVKSEKFREAVTKLIRGWTGWRPFISSVAQEDGLFGFTSVFWPDKFSWKPKHFRQDRFLVPDQSEQEVNSLPIFIAKQELQIHELATLIGNREAAESAGWDVEEAVKAINEASPKDSIKGDPTNVRSYEDAIRESSVLLSLQAGTKVIEVNHVLIAEVDGKVSYYVVNNKGDRALLRQQLDYYNNMAEAVALFSYQQANGLLMGSKGVGRELYELAGAIDRSRNELVDRLVLSGKVWLRGPDRVLDRLKLSVVGNAVFVSDQVQVESVRIDSGVDAAVTLDGLLTSFMDQIAGGVTPRQLQGERVTATQVNLYASREEEKRDDLIERFIFQASEVVTNIQRRVSHPSTVDEDANLFREDMLRYLSEDELQYLASQPALRTVADWTDMQAQNIVLFAQEKRSDPLYDQVKLARKSAAARIDAEFADDVVLPVNDPTQEAEQTRQQVLENFALSSGVPLPVSPRDNHQIHIEVLKQELAKGIQAMQEEGPSLLPGIEAFIQHYTDHVGAAIQGGAPEGQFSEDIRQIKAATANLNGIKESLQAAAEESQKLAGSQGGQPQQQQQLAPVEQMPPQQPPAV